MMKHYEKLLAKGSFSREQLIEIVGTATAANQVIYEYQKKGLIEKPSASHSSAYSNAAFFDSVSAIVPTSRSP